MAMISHIVDQTYISYIIFIKSYVVDVSVVYSAYWFLIGRGRRPGIDTLNPGADRGDLGGSGCFKCFELIQM